jgi:hypothetical protein
LPPIEEDPIAYAGDVDGSNGEGQDLDLTEGRKEVEASLGERFAGKVRPQRLPREDAPRGEPGLD